MLGCSFAVSRGRLWEVANGLSVHHLVNPGGCLVRSRCLEGWIPSLSLLRDCSRNSTIPETN